ncbi:uncharacterized protein LOC116258170 isoform X2 [Nymphaea colorata]|nr:uncharacterized protein LOC116258170 isoform X2 [Nymphaea colorata]XP_049935219.1 uncharacterized protein LOC116258170 isoform X2 [Nymphaea colorata]
MQPEFTGTRRVKRNGDGVDTSRDKIYCTRMSPGLDAWRREVGNSSAITGCTSLCRECMVRNESQGIVPPFRSYHRRDLYMRTVTARHASNDPMERRSSGCFGCKVYTNLHGRQPEGRSPEDDNLKRKLADAEKRSASFCHDFTVGKFTNFSGCMYVPFGDIYDGHDDFPHKEQLLERNSLDKEHHMLQDSFIQLHAGATLLCACTSNMHAGDANIWNQAALSSDASAFCCPQKGYSTNQPSCCRGPSDPRLKLALAQKEPQNYTSPKRDNSASSFNHVIPASFQTKTIVMNAPNLVSGDQSVKLSTLLDKTFEASKQNIHLQNLLNSASLAASQLFCWTRGQGTQKISRTWWNRKRSSEIIKPLG